MGTEPMSQSASLVSTCSGAGQMDTDFEAQLAELRTQLEILIIVNQGTLALLEDMCNGRGIEPEEVRTLARTLDQLLNIEGL